MKKWTLTLLVALMLLAAMPARPALAAAAAPAKLSAIDVQVWPEEVPGSTVVIVVATVPSSTPLPAQVTLPLPKGAQVTWAGEIFPSGSQQDIQRTPQVAGDKVTVTAEKSRQVQYEANLTGPAEHSGRRFAAVDWVQGVGSDTLQFSFKLPSWASEVKTTPAYAGTPDINAKGEKLYSLQPVDGASGKTTSVSIEYARSTSPATSGAKPDYLLWGLLGLLALAVVVLIVVAQRNRAPRSSTPEE